MNPRRHFSPGQKFAALRRHLLELVPVSTHNYTPALHV